MFTAAPSAAGCCWLRFRAWAPPFATIVAVNGVRRPPLALQLYDPVVEQVVHCRLRTGVPSLAHLGDQRCSCLLRFGQGAVEDPARLPAFAGDRVATGSTINSHAPGDRSRIPDAVRRVTTPKS